MFKKIITTAVLTATISTFACTIDGQEGILPENNLWISTSAKSMNAMTEATFNNVIDKVEAIYKPIITNEFGAKLTIERNWEDGTVNAYAQQQGKNWNVAMFGGLARHETITADGFALVVCHEVGHHIGGAPKKRSWFGTSWVSNEGQSDYFATLKCLRKMFRAENNKEIVARLNVPAAVTAKCSEQFTSEEDRLICQRGAMAGMSTAKLFQALRKQETAPKFTTPDAKIVKKTSDNHPATQCRLDTYFAGATCYIDETIDVSNKDEAVGVCYKNSGDTSGTRPSCWFKSK